MNKDNEAKDFKQLGFDDKDLVMFTITDLKLENSKDQVHMMISLKRKIQTEMLTTYLPTLLLLAISYATIYFKPVYFEASLTVNLTIMLVMTTIFTSKIAELPPTSDTKMIDIWLIFCLLVPFAFALVQTAIEYYREDEITDAESGRPEAWSEQSQDGGVVCIRLLRVSSVFQKLQDNRSDGKGQDVPHTMKADMASSTLKTLQWTGFHYFAKKNSHNDHCKRCYRT